ncbi:2'-5' RNA ligase [[Clostridium] ultunense Esp]|uniref:RNA 2',3'-cyclic phosphodiesterase n=1 Tax=[Clostridium] ultunense Esp TaxID=1288971 RepID=M1Z2K4_9FIRM|nr:RNA 2',3'-cyclic phosphodiesterase [Schnuerera ultunensis]CCQ97100.1 2'-5' RNA ligase [[Clostridium] ultunense Esp]SHD78499.1 2'-5' RNA ligase [[Clostridium] ultunense Esp]
MRAFIGMDFDKGLKDELNGIQKVLKINSKKGNWVPSSNFHITLKFLGDISEEQVDAIDRIIKSAVVNTSPLSITLDKLGYFNIRSNQYGVIWIGIKGEMMKLNAIYGIIEKEMKVIGFPKEKRKLTPHITLGRRVILDLPFSQLREQVDHELGKEFLLDNLTLMKSEEIMRKRVYTPIKSYKFNKILEKNHR